MKSQPLELNADFIKVLDLVEKTNQNFFITGRAGTGKSTLLQLFRNTTKKKTIVLAPTGIAAINVKGQTIHSFFGFPPRLLSHGDIQRRKYRKLYQNLEVIIIDEISMVRADMVDNIDRFLRINRDNSEPFGGVQMVFFGDLFQLPPVIAGQVEKKYFRANFSSPYFFSSKVIENGWPFEMIELYKIYRQEERNFIQLLDSIRTRSLDYDDFEELNERHEPREKGHGPFVTLCSINAIADKINQEKLKELDTQTEEYRAKVSGDFHTRLFPTEAFLTLKLGAQVMFLTNDNEKKRYVNGTIGIITKLAPDSIKIAIEREEGASEEIELEKFEWEILRYQHTGDQKNPIESKSVGTFTQYPIKLAWAITIHKSQGKTFDRVVIDLGRGAFEYGQTYVALSRCRTLKGIELKKPLKPSDIIVDDRIIEFYETKRRYS